MENGKTRTWTYLTPILTTLSSLMLLDSCCKGSRHTPEIHIATLLFWRSLFYPTLCFIVVGANSCSQQLIYWWVISLAKYCNSGVWQEMCKLHAWHCGFSTHSHLQWPLEGTARLLFVLLSFGFSCAWWQVSWFRQPFGMEWLCIFVSIL